MAPLVCCLERFTLSPSEKDDGARLADPEPLRQLRDGGPGLQHRLDLRLVVCLAFAMVK